VGFFDSDKKLFWGYTAAAVNVLVDAYGSLLTKQHAGSLNTFDISLVRFGSAAAMLLATALAMRICALASRPMASRARRRRDSSDRQATSGSVGSVEWFRLPPLSRAVWLRIGLGVVFVTFICPALSNYALFEMDLGLSLTLMSLSPLFSLPIGWMMDRKPITRKDLLGSCLAVGGVAMICFE